MKKKRGAPSKEGAVDWVFPLIGILLALLIAFGLGYLSHQSSVGERPHPTYSELANGRAQLHIPCEKMRSREESDLCAQWVAASAAAQSSKETKRATGWSIAGVIASLVTVIGLTATIAQTSGALGEARRGNLLSMRENARATRRSLASARETSAALAAAERNAAATMKHADLMEKALKAQLRAYLVIDSIKPVLATPNEITVKLTVRNAGLTPANLTTSCATMWVAGGLCLDPLSAGPAPPVRYHLTGWLPQNQARSCYINFNDKSAIAKINDHDQWDAFVYGRLEFLDAFGSPHWVTFAYCLNAWTFSSEAEYKPCIRGNAAD